MPTRAMATVRFEQKGMCMRDGTTQCNDIAYWTSMWVLDGIYVWYLWWIISVCLYHNALSQRVQLPTDNNNSSSSSSSTTNSSRRPHTRPPTSHPSQPRLHSPLHLPTTPMQGGPTGPRGPLQWGRQWLQGRHRRLCRSRPLLNSPLTSHSRPLPNNPHSSHSNPLPSPHSSHSNPLPSPHFSHSNPLSSPLTSHSSPPNSPPRHMPLCPSSLQPSSRLLHQSRPSPSPRPLPSSRLLHQSRPRPLHLQPPHQASPRLAAAHPQWGRVCLGGLLHSTRRHRNSTPHRCVCMPCTVVMVQRR